MKLVRATVDSLPVGRPASGAEYPQGMCLDKGYDFAEVRRTGVYIEIVGAGSDRTKCGSAADPRQNIAKELAARLRLTSPVKPRRPML